MALSFATAPAPPTIYTLAHDRPSRAASAEREKKAAVTEDTLEDTNASLGGEQVENSIASVPVGLLSRLRGDLLDWANHSHHHPYLVAEEEMEGEPQPRSDGFAVLPSAPPNLYASRSAPVGDLQELVDQSSSSHRDGDLPPTPSQRAFVAMTRASSFHGDLAYPGGDTQPMESQVYRDYSESMVKSANTTPMKKMAFGTMNGGVVALHEGGNANAETYDTTITDKTPRTCVEGDTGYIDIVGGFHPSPPPPTQSDAGEFIEDLLAESEAEIPDDQILPIAGAVLQTPATAGRKYGRDGEVLNSAATTARKTPRYSQLFAFGRSGGGKQGQLLSATQLFNQTQNPSSPFAANGEPMSDPVVTRPSPNLNQQFSISSPEVLISSPMATMPNRLSGPAIGEPRGSYTSIRESQEQHRLAELRAAELRKEYGIQGRFSDDGAAEGDEDEDDEAEPDRERRRFEQKRLRRVLSDQQLTEWSRISAPLRPGSSSVRMKPLTIDLITSPAVPTVLEQTEGQIEIELSGDEGHGTDEEGSHVDLIGGHEGEDDDEYDELGQTVLKSQSHVQGAIGSERDEEEVEDEDRNNDDEHRNSGDITRTPDQLSSNGPQHLGVQHVAIADSQPERQDLGHINLSQHNPGHSSMSAFIPGSQYTGKTSQDQARHSKHKTVHQQAHRSSGDQADNGRIPSSPPLFETVGSELPHSVAGNDEVLAPHQDHARSNVIEIDEVPESDIAMPAPFTNEPTDLPTANIQNESTETTSVPLFSTARTHASDHQRQDQLVRTASNIDSPHKRFASQQSKNSNASQSPRKAAGVRRFAEIARNASPSPSRASGESQVDVDAIVSGIITAEDREHIQAMSSPTREERPAKRRRLMRSKSDRVDGVDSHLSFRLQPPESLPDKRRESDRADWDIARQNSTSSLSNVLRNSPSKANEMPVSTPNEKELTLEHEVDTPDSVRIRELAGAAAASQLLSKRTTSNTSSSKQARNRKRTAGAKSKSRVDKTAKKTSTSAQPISSPDPVLVDDAATGKGTNGRAVKRGKKLSLSSRSGNPPHQFSAKQDGIDPGEQEEREEIDGVNQVEDGVIEPNGRADQRGDIEIQNQFSRNRVFANFRGSINNFYPATWLSASADGKTHHVRFDDDAITSVESPLMGALDLRSGDAVKIDVLGMRGKTWIIAGFGPVNPNSRSVDMYGHDTVKVEMKTSRTSGTGANGMSSKGETIEVEIERVYLSPTMWPAFADRIFTPPALDRTFTSRAATPSSGVQLEAIRTPGSRTRRSNLPPAKAIDAHSREQPLASTIPLGDKGVFSNMAFAISYGGNDSEKAEVTRMIARHGGLVLETGFDELFDLPDLDEATASTDRTPLVDGENSALRLKAEFEGLGFVALIADRHSRRAKYVQALALGLPTLSGRWVVDSIQRLKNSGLSAEDLQQPLPWARYLLPAGESIYLNGAVRSRTIPIYNPTSTRSLASTINARERLLDAAAGVLIVVPRKSKAAWEKRKTYAFLTLALGAGGVRRVADLAEAKALVTQQQKLLLREDDHSPPQQQWRWIYVDSNVAEASTTVFGRTVAGPSKNNNNTKKRKLGAETAISSSTWTSDSVKVVVNKLSATDGHVRIVNDEFVVQSLILGALVE